MTARRSALLRRPRQPSYRLLMVTADLVYGLRHGYAEEPDAVDYFDRIGSLAAGR